MDSIPLTALLPAGIDPKQHTVHFAIWNQIKHPIDVLASSQEEWQGWNSIGLRHHMLGSSNRGIEGFDERSRVAKSSARSTRARSSPALRA